MSSVADRLFAELAPQIREAIESALASGFEAGVASTRTTDERTLVRRTTFEVFSAVRDVTGLQDIRRPGRSRSQGDQLAARWAAAVILSADLRLSTNEIALLVGWRNHSTVAYVLREYGKKPEVVSVVNRVRDRLAKAAA